MPTVLMIRHAETAWNVQRRIQGHTDTPLSSCGMKEAAARILPDEFKPGVWYVSPLRRARQTATLMGAIEFRVEPLLIEMNWGQWEGKRLSELRENDPEGMAAKESMGLDFSAPSGESPRAVQARLTEWFKHVHERGEDCIAVTHKGVIRACLAAALAWDMQDKPPVKLDWQCAHLFDVVINGTVSLLRANIKLHASDG